MLEALCCAHRLDPMRRGDHTRSVEAGQLDNGIGDAVGPTSDVYTLRTSNAEIRRRNVTLWLSRTSPRLSAGASDCGSTAGCGLECLIGPERWSSNAPVRRVRAQVSSLSAVATKVTLS